MNNPINQYKKTRIAPTPSGYLHLGNVLSFAITAALARQNGAKILLRIDDLDRERADERYIQDIFDTLQFLKIPWDEGPVDLADFEANYSQVHRMDIYQQSLKQLADKGMVYACSCSRSELNTKPCRCFDKQISLTAENVSWRLITGEDDSIYVKNYTGDTVNAIIPAEMRDFVVKKKDGFPAYQLTSVIDDIFYGVDMIVRGNDLWPSTLAQHKLASALKKNDFTNITFCHHTLLMEQPGKKLSKSAGSTSVHYVRQNGKNPADIYSLIADMAGNGKRVTDWQQLADIVIPLL